MTIIKSAVDVSKTISENRTTMAEDLNKFIYRYLNYGRSRASGYRMTMLYTTYKFNALFNCIGQLFAIGYIIGEEDPIWGINVINFFV